MSLYDRVRNYATAAFISRLPDAAVMIEGAKRMGINLRESIVQTQSSIRAQEIKDWKAAVEAAMHPEEPNRFLLYDNYENTDLDLQLTTVIETRVLDVLSSNFKLYNRKTKEEDSEKTEILEESWFEDFMRYVVLAEFWGDTLIDIFDTDENGLIERCEIFPRRHVVPEKGIVVNQVGDQKGTDYTDEQYRPYYIFIKGVEGGLGMYKKIAPIVLAKRWALAYWNQYDERYGNPFRWIKTPGGNDKRDKALAKILENMGANGWGIFWDGEEFGLQEAQKGQGAVDIFEKLIARLDGYVSKAILGQTMTTDDGSSLSQAVVHEGVAEDRHEYDRRRVKNIVNKVLIPQLIKRGYPLEGYYFDWDDQMTPADKLQRIISLSQSGYVVDPEWITEETGIPILGVQQPSIGNAMAMALGNQAPPKKKTVISKFKNILASLGTMYMLTCGCDVHAADVPMDGERLEKITNRIIKLIHTGQLRGNAQADLSLIVANSLHEALEDSFKLDTVEYDAPENSATVQMRNSIYSFAVAKSYSAIKAMTDQLFDVDGNVKRFSDFKRDALEVHEQYNVDWLKSEYNHAVASMQMGKRWLDYERNADTMPYLTYRTAGDERVRDSHRDLDGKTFPVDGAFWKTHYPPNGWGCRCDVEQTNDNNQLTSEAEERELLSSVKVDPMFRTNTGKSGIVFKDNHPYFSDVDGKVTDLDAERDYGMKPVSNLLADRNKLPAQSEDASDLDSWWTRLKARRGFGEDVSLKDRNANALLLKKDVVSDKAIAANIENVLSSPSEVWNRTTGTTYLKYYKDSVMAIEVSPELVISNTVITSIKGASKTVSKYRKGVLMYR